MATQGTINDVMPDELLREIFLHCLPWDPLKYKQPDVMIAPMLLCHVCSQWRAIAFQTPLLWTELYYTITSLSPVGPFNPRDVDFLPWWRDRVQDVSPSIRFAFKEPKDDPDYSDEEDEQAMVENIHSSEFISFLVQFMSNARYLNLDSHCTHLSQMLGERPFTCPNLDTLVVLQSLGHRAPQACGNTAMPGPTGICIPISNQHSIRRLAIEGNFKNAQDVSTILKFSNITHLNLAIHITLPGWFSLLRASANLVYGSFSITFHGEDTNYTPEPKVLPHLQQMTFENFGIDLKQSFLDGLQLPSLIGLRVDNHMPLTVEHLHRVLTSTPALRILHLGPMWTDDEALMESVFVPGDLSPTLTPLVSIVPQLESIYFEGTTSMVDIFAPENRHFVISVLNGDWLQLGKPPSRISRVYLGNFWDDGNVEWGDIVNLVDDLRKFMPARVELAVRPYNAAPLWSSYWKRGDFTDEFEGLGFDSDI